MARPFIPSDEAIAARAAELELTGPGGRLSPHTRQQVAAILAKEAAPAPTAPAPELRSRQEFPVEGGTLRIDTVFIPRKDPS